MHNHKFSFCRELELVADVGGWNNIRMQMEIVLVFAYATGRTLVLPVRFQRRAMYYTYMYIIFLQKPLF